MRKLLSSFPVLVNEWHPSKNGDLKPEDFAKSSKRKIWWLCSKGHEWEATIGNRTGRKSGCPVCAGKKASADRNLEVDCPEVAKEWHPSKNSDSKPSDLTVGSKKKVWWQCSKGHEWEAAISNRTGNKSGCPFCNGRQLVNFPEAYPEVAAQWHPVRNGGCKPEDFTHASSKKVWWLCPEGHEWESQIANRTKTDKPTGCPICLGRKQEDLAVTNSKVAAQWHPSKNGESKPEDFTAGSSKKVWWLCSKGHEWEAIISSRTKMKGGTGCPICLGRRQENLVVTNPEVAAQWHPSKNEESKPEDFTAGSSEKVWWLCSIGHEWKSVVKNRTKKKPSGCPVCSGRAASVETNLAAKYPEVAAQWHPKKNEGKIPELFTSGSNNNVWWQCKEGHEWKTQINTRTQNGADCPYCSGRYLTEENSLKCVYPEVADQWHPTKNGAEEPQDYFKGSNKKVWWLCSKGHEWEAAIGNRTGSKSGCPKCSNQSSKPEMRLLSELQGVFHTVISRYKVDGVEADIFIPKYNVAIEYDGSYWHRNKRDKDQQKNVHFQSRGVRIVRVRENPLETIGPHDLIVRADGMTKCDLNKLLETIFPWVDEGDRQRVNEYIQKADFINNDLYREYLDCFPNPLPEKSLKFTHPHLSKEWDYGKNEPLKPENFTFGTNQIAWWLCPEGHSYESRIISRTGGSRCPICRGFNGERTRRGASPRLPLEERTVAHLCPHLVSEWHSKKNGSRTPFDFSVGSSQKVWWQCFDGHEWEATISNRTKPERPSGCPDCFNARRGGVRHPNGPLTAQQIIEYANMHFEISGQWPNEDSKWIIDGIEEGWASISAALAQGLRELAGASSLSKLLDEAGLKQSHKNPFVPTKSDLKKAIAHHQEKNNKYPGKNSGEIDFFEGVKWDHLNNRLIEGKIKNVGKTTLAEFIKSEFDYVNPMNPRERSDLKLEEILEWMDAFYKQHGKYPGQTSQPINEMGDEKWVNIDAALRSGGRGLPKSGGLAGLKLKHKGVRNNFATPNLTEKKIIEWMVAFHLENGRWPQVDEGEIADHPGEKWANVNSALHNGGRGLGQRGRSLKRLQAKAEKELKSTRNHQTRLTA